MLTHKQREHRNEFRWKVVKHGKIVLPGQPSAIDVAIRDLSINGARVAVPSELSLPLEFDIWIPVEGFRCAVRVCWRSRDEIGLELVGPPHMVAAPEAKDMIEAEYAAAEPGLPAIQPTTWACPENSRNALPVGRNSPLNERLGLDIDDGGQFRNLMPIRRP